MSFTRQIREEIAAARPKNRCCRSAIRSGMLFGVWDGSPSDLVEDARLIYFRITSGLYPKEIPSDALAYPVIPEEQFVCENCRWNFVKGVFLSCGTVSKPESSYHAEMLIRGEERAAALAALLESLGQIPGVIARKNGKYGVYFKNSEEISDFLGFLGAGKAVFRLLDAKIYRDLRNEANRVSNCELANIRHTVDASAEQMKAIRIIIDRGAEVNLSDELRQTFDLRAAFPDDTLSELAEKHVPKITKSGVNHRLRRIVDFAGTLL